MTAFSFDAGTADFTEKVLQASHKVPVLVDFWAEWCAPCRALKPVLEKLVADFGGRILLAKVDSDRNPELVARYGVRGIPSVKAFVGGELRSEFSGALPEAQVLAFIDKLLPSRAEPLRVAAQEARAKGEPEVARSLLDDALTLDPGCETSRLDLAELLIEMKHTDTARAMLDADEHRVKDVARLRALQARLKLANTGIGSDPAVLKARIDANDADLDARLRLAAALALEDDYRPALEQLLEVIRRDRKWQDEAARRSMLDLFALLATDPQYDDLVREFRIRLARTLN